MKKLLESLKKLVTDCGLRIERTLGIYLKPLTTAQIDSLELPEHVHQGFFELCQVRSSFSPTRKLNSIRWVGMSRCSQWSHGAMCRWVSVLISTR